MGFTPEQLSLFQTLIRVSSSLSIFGTLAIIVSYCSYARFRTQMNTMVVFMSVADLLSSLQTLLGDWPNRLALMEGTVGPNILCTVQSFGIQMWFISATFWTGCMATHCLMAVVLSKPIAHLEPYYKYYHAVSWGIPLIFAFLPFAFQTKELGPIYVHIGNWCWIGGNYSLFRMYLFYGLVWAIFLYNVICYSIVGYKISQMSKFLNDTQHAMKTRKHTSRFVLKTLVYMGAFLINWVFSTANRIQALVDPTPSYFLNLLQCITLPLQGFMNALIYFAFAYYSIEEAEEDNQSSNKKDSESGGMKY